LAAYTEYRYTVNPVFGEGAISTNSKFDRTATVFFTLDWGDQLLRNIANNLEV
jgi:hypothetical protein